MGVPAAIFESVGERTAHFIPTAATRLDTSAVAGVGANQTVNAVILGEAQGGEPGKALRISDPNQAAEVFKGGPLVDAVIFSLSPSPTIRPGAVFGVRTNLADKASLTLLATATDTVDVEDRDFGVAGNQIQIEVAAGTTEGKKLTILKADVTETFDNVITKFFDIQYTGGQATSQLDITATALTTTTGLGGDDLNILFSTVNTIQDVISAVDSHPNYTATVQGSTTESPDKMDEVTITDVKASAHTVLGVNFAVIKTLSEQSGIVNAKFPTTGSRLPPDNIAFTFLAGGAENTPTSSANLTTTLDGLLTEDLFLFALVDSDAALQAALLAHIQFANSVFGKAERQGYIGDDFGKTKSVAITDSKASAKVNNNGDISFLINGFTRRDRFGVVRNYGSIFRAAMEAGLKSALSLPEPTTNKTLDVLDSEFKFNRSELEDLIINGVAASNVEAGINEVRVVRSISTFQGTNLIESENSMKQSGLFMARSIRNLVETRHKGKPLDALRVSFVLDDVRAQLNDFKKDGLITADPNDPNGNPAFRDLRGDIQNGDQLVIRFFANLTAPTNFIFITLGFGIITDVGS